MSKQYIFSPPMAGEISPNIMFFKNQAQRCVNACNYVYDGFRWSQWDGVTRRNRKIRGKEIEKARAGRVLKCMTTAKKLRKSAGTKFRV